MKAFTEGWENWPFKAFSEDNRIRIVYQLEEDWKWREKEQQLMKLLQSPWRKVAMGWGSGKKYGIGKRRTARGLSD